MNHCRHAFATFSFVAEIFIFLYVGMDALDIEKWKFVSDRYVKHTCRRKSWFGRLFDAEFIIILYSIFSNLECLRYFFCSLFSHFSVRIRPGTSVAVSSILLGLILFGRAAFVFPLSFLSNLAKKTPNEKIGFKQQVSVSFLKVPCPG